MNIKDMREYRKKFNLKLIEAYDFFNDFGALDDNTHSASAIDKKHKELMRLAMQVLEEFTSEK